MSAGPDTAARRDAAAGSRPEAREVLHEGRRVLRVEADALAALADRLDAGFLRATELVAEADGVVLVAGIGKSGIVARKVAATLTSTGTPAVFLHPVEGLHGDLGLAEPGTVLIAISRSGASSELDGLVAFALAHRIPMVAVTGDVSSPLAMRADAVLDCGVDAEACPIELAPTSSTTAAMAMGDALAAALVRQRGFSPSDFARIHPGGALGRRLTLRVRDVMVDEGFPVVGDAAVVRDVIVPLARMRGTVPVTGDDGALAGVVTAGDLARLMEETDDFLSLPVARFMTRTPRIALPDELAAAAAGRMEEYGIMALPVVDPDRLVGIVHLHDLLRAGAR